jgi:SWI/SNF-related matrix-associated actin-dependent regulator 1 of chromatin subfamily A
VKELFPYQRAGADWLKTQERAILGDEMGLGKTVQAIVAASELGLKRVLVVCPAIGRGNWLREFAEWAPEITPVVYSYDEVVRTPLKVAPVAGVWDLLILDEAHYLKTPKAKRTAVIYGTDQGAGLKARLAKEGPPRKSAVEHSRRVWLLSGTIAPNNASELWTHLHALFGETRRFVTFMNAYCYTRPSPFGKGYTVGGNKKKMIPELKAKLAQIMLRRRAADVLTELPPITLGPLLLDGNVVEGIQQMLEFEAEAMRVNEAAKIYARTGDMDLALAEASPQLSVLRRETGRAKAAAVARYVGEELISGAIDKIVLFAVHHDVLDTLERLLAEFAPVRVDGRVTNSQRNKGIHAFQTDPSRRVFIGQIQACGTAVTLHAANQQVFVEQSWVPGENAQAAKRCHRIGQTRPVFVRVASVAGTLDEAIDRALTRKTRALLEIEITKESHP